MRRRYDVKQSLLRTSIDNKRQTFSFLRALCELRALRVEFLVIILSLLSVVSCVKQEKQGELLIAVSIAPQQWFVSQAAGDKAQVLVLVPPGQNPHNYEPGPRQIQALSDAGAWVLSGSEFEISLRPKVASLFSGLLIVDGTEGVTFRTLEEHEDDGDHSHSLLEIDRHTWLGREPAKLLAACLKNTLVDLDAANADYYNERYVKLVNLIDEEFDRLKIDLEPLRGGSVFVYHPSFGYFLDEFGIRQVAVETGGKEPSPRELNNLINKLKEEKASAIFVQAQFPANAVRTLAFAAGVELIALDPLAPDWLENIRDMGAALRQSAPVKSEWRPPHE